MLAKLLMAVGITCAAFIMVVITVAIAFTIARAFVAGFKYGWDA